MTACLLKWWAVLNSWSQGKGRKAVKGGSDLVGAGVLQAYESD